jgi:hypothetical protein
MYYAETTPFEEWRRKHMAQLAVSREVMELIAEAFQAGYLYAQSKERANDTSNTA